jgi:division protein CdvB (Snf7/Vps24/ESCRT-III family)
VSFEKRWEKKEDSSTSSKVKDTLNPSDPIKSRLNALIKRIELENQRLEQASIRFQDRDKIIFKKVVDAYSKHDTISANVYANEVAAIRKMEKMIFDAMLALEQIALRTKTATGLGDVAVTLSPVMGVMNDIKSGIASINPQTEKELGEISSLLNGIVIDAGAVTEMNINFESVNEDSSKIIKEAQVIAESRTSEAFPKLPEAEASQPISEHNKHAQLLKERF